MRQYFESPLVAVETVEQQPDVHPASTLTVSYLQS